jgi:hypothetical protein
VQVEYVVDGMEVDIRCHAELFGSPILRGGHVLRHRWVVRPVSPKRLNRRPLQRGAEEKDGQRQHRRPFLGAVPNDPFMGKFNGNRLKIYNLYINFGDWYKTFLLLNINK